MVFDVAGGVGLSEPLPDAFIRLGVTVQLAPIRDL
jgi:hypothetical protein